MSARPTTPALRAAEQHHADPAALAMTRPLQGPRVGLVYGDYPPNPPGRGDGGSDFLQRLAEGLVARGHEVTAIVSRRSDRMAEFTTEGGVRVAPVIGDWTLRGAAGGQLAVLKRVLKEHRIDLVHLIYPDPFLRYGSNSYHLPFLLKFATDRPLVVTFFGFGVTGSSAIAKAGLFSLFAEADRLVITDADLLRRFRRTLPWWGGKARSGLVGGIASEGSPIWSRQDLEDRKEAVGLRAHQRHIGFFGFWSPDKGLENLLEAHRLLRLSRPDTILVLLGGRATSARFEYERGILRMADQLGLADSVIETGPVSAAEVSRYMVAMDVCALPFKVNPLGRSSLALALSLGVPTIVTRPQGADAELLAGLPLLESPDPVRIAAAIAELLDNPPASQSAAESALRASRHWSWDAIVRQYAGLYGELVGGHRSR